MIRGGTPISSLTCSSGPGGDPVTIGVDLEQFCRDPYASGIQRVVQQLALHWPRELPANFIVPSWEGRWALLDAGRTAELLAIPFTTHEGSEQGNDANHGLRWRVHEALEHIAQDDAVRKVEPGELIAMHDAWLLPEVSYLPGVLDRMHDALGRIPTSMIGYDALPMTEAANYRFVPGVGANASEYFRLLATVDRVVCISDWSRREIVMRLRRDPQRLTSVAHPGGDHVPVAASGPRRSGPVRLLRVGTMEQRKQPREILEAFLAARAEGLDAELTFVGNPNSSDEEINTAVRAACAADPAVRWIVGATDAEVADLIRDADWFLSFGVEGYGIPVLEAIRLGTGVLFDGVQPAAEIMEGVGAVRVSLDEGLARMLERAGQQASALDPLAVPTWARFARDVAEAAAP